MSTKKLLIISRYGKFRVKKRVQSIDPYTMKKWFFHASILKKIFRYRRIIWEEYDFNTVEYPFFKSVMMRLLCCGKIYFKDNAGKKQQITIFQIFRSFFRHCCDYCSMRHIIKKGRNELKNLSLTNNFINKDAHDPVVYIRSDLWFGLRSGGSVGHTAGVLNGFKAHQGDVLFFSTDSIPTVRSDIEQHIVRPGRCYWDFPDILALKFNDMLFQQVIGHIGERRPSFIYQRYSINNYCGLKLAKHYGCPFILEYNGSEVWVSKNWSNRTIHCLDIVRTVEQKNLDAANFIIVVSDVLKESLISNGIPEDKILVNPNGVDAEVYTPEASGAKMRMMHGFQNKTVVGFMGTFSQWHGVIEMAHAVKKIAARYPKNTLAFLFIGSGPLLSQVEKILSEVNDSAHIVFTGRVPQAQGADYLAACDIVLSPHVQNKDSTRFFGSPTKLFEYMAMEKAIVASDLEQIGQVLEHERTALLVPPGDIDALAQATGALIDDPALRKKLGEEARQEVLQNYTWTKHVNRILRKIGI